ncbi:MAG: LysE family translocator [Corynebacterium sp.]|uniref:LysE family translocator n=1 Tax=unclassified Corynebacterium TaxID=2624378 RepID=UPI0026485CC4|nr:LysE family transporter [Corynebacterium sp.]MDN5581800.1 LysE family transporter [Corynebacterium sp.]MDN5719180.1 LysE family transporter [Corynebacterium sp.]MDN6259247.1 LysE family transporter [Corynebacterium sp.]MDN6325533.1 LysE family transporter [Corynebacterium sp.]
MTGGALLSILVAWLLAIASPGPDLVQILRLGAVRRNGVACALGIMSGNTLWILASMVGLSALVDAFPWVLTVLFLVGGGFLLWMGQGALRGGLAERRSAGTTVTATTAEKVSTATAWRLGLMTNLANPKALVFFGAVFAGFVPPDTGWGMRLVVLLMMLVTGVAWFVLVAVMVSVPALSRRLQAAGPWIDIVAGAVFLVLGVILVGEGVMETVALLR